MSLSIVSVPRCSLSLYFFLSDAPRRQDLTLTYNSKSQDRRSLENLVRHLRNLFLTHPFSLPREVCIVFFINERSKLPNRPRIRIDKKQQIQVFPICENLFPDILLIYRIILMQPISYPNKGSRKKNMNIQFRMVKQKGKILRPFYQNSHTFLLC